MKDDSVIVIGAGLGGLAAGCYLQMNGYKSHIFEHHSVPGGVAACWKRKGFLIDGGIHFIMGHRPGTGLYEVYRELGAAGDGRFVDLPTYGRYVDEITGRCVDVTGDLDALARDLGAFAPQDTGVITEIIKGARTMKGVDMSEMGLSKPPELTGWFDQVITIWKMRRMLRLYAGKMSKSVDEYVSVVRDPWLREFLQGLFLPEVPVWFVCMLLALVADGQIGLLKRGCLDFVLAIERRFKELGGEVTYKAKVERVLVENDTAVGVQLGDGTERCAGTVVSAADGHSTVYGMLGGKYLSDEMRRRYETWPLYRPYVIVTYGVAREFPGDPPFTGIKLREPITVGGESVTGLLLRNMSYGPDFAAPGKTVMQVEFETEWDYWNELQARDRRLYDAEKERVASEVLKRLETHYPGISSQVEMTDVATPYTIWRYTLNYRASYMGWVLTPETVKARFERTLPGLANFYLAGQWAMGGGVNSVLYSGQHVAQLLCKRDGKRFATNVA